MNYLKGQELEPLDRLAEQLPDYYIQEGNWQFIAQNHPLWQRMHIDMSIQLPKLLDRLYRVEGSRNRNKGGAGLGLAICKNIVDGHHGSITTAKSTLGGLLIKVDLPLKS